MFELCGEPHLQKIQNIIMESIVGTGETYHVIKMTLKYALNSYWSLDLQFNLNKWLKSNGMFANWWGDYLSLNFVPNFEY